MDRKLQEYKCLISKESMNADTILRELDDQVLQNCILVVTAPSINDSSLWWAIC